MEYILGPALAAAVSLGFTQFKLKKQSEEYKALKAQVEKVDVELGRKMLGAMLPMSKSIKELQEFTGMR
jgi:hypothetical protein